MLLAGNDGEWSFNSSRSTDFEYVFERSANKAAASKATKEAAKGGKQIGKAQAKAKGAGRTRAAKTEAASVPQTQATNKKQRRK